MKLNWPSVLFTFGYNLSRIVSFYILRYIFFGRLPLFMVQMLGLLSNDDFVVKCLIFI